MSVAVVDEVGYAGLGEETASRLFAASLSKVGLDVARIGEVSVALVDAETIRDLNLRFRGRDEPTDVLSFEVDGPYGEMVGEVVICPSCAAPRWASRSLSCTARYTWEGWTTARTSSPARWPGCRWP